MAVAGAGQVAVWRAQGAAVRSLLAVLFWRCNLGAVLLIIPQLAGSYKRFLLFPLLLLKGGRLFCELGALQALVRMLSHARPGAIAAARCGGAVAGSCLATVKVRW